jgi:PAS domain S-box-containing protein
MKLHGANRSELEARLEFLEQSEAMAHLGGWRANAGPEKVLEFTAESYRILGFDPGEVVRNIDFYNMIHPDDRELFLETVVWVRTERTPSDVAVRVVRRDGSLRHVHVTATLANNGTDQALTGTIQDVTDTRRDGKDPASELRHRITQDLRAALDAGDQLFVEYQPVMSIAENAYIGAEALVRWNHPERGLLKPTEFVGLAEETGLIVPLGTFVLTTACHVLRWWRDGGLGTDLTMSVNLSPPQLRVPGFVTVLAATIEEAGIPGSSLVLEITESILVEGALDEEVFRAIRDLGVRIAIDDFGTKYSALNYLSRLPIDALKIDESFVRGIDDGAGRVVATAIAALGRALGIDVIAEGVETRAQLETLREIGCDAIQGFYISAPVGPDACFDLLRSRPTVQTS